MPNFDFTLNSYNLSKVGLFDTGLREQNIYLSPKPAKKFNNSATRKDYLLKNNIPYDPNGGFYTEDSESLITWTYVADYSLHRYHTSPIKNFYIHCRINKKGQLEFGSFDRIIGDKGTSSAYIFNSDLENKNQSFPLKIANKKEAENFILNTSKNKIKISSNAKFAGYLINEEDYIINDTAVKTYGHIWTYWYTIENNTLYFCGFPLYTLDIKGYNLENNELVSYEMGPTKYNIDVDLGLSEIFTLFYEENADNLVKNLLQKYGDQTESTNILSSFIAESQNLKLYQKTHSDFNYNISAMGLYGGIYKSEMYDMGDIDEVIYDENQTFKGNSGFIAIKTLKSRKMESDTGQTVWKYYPNAIVSSHFEVIMNGNNYDISLGTSDQIYKGESFNINGGDDNDIFINFIPPGPIIIPSIDDEDDEEETTKKSKTATIICGNIGSWYVDDETYYTNKLPLYYSSISYSPFDYDINSTITNYNKSRFKAVETGTTLKSKMDFSIYYNSQDYDDMNNLYIIPKYLNHEYIMPIENEMYYYYISPANHTNAGLALMTYSLEPDDNANIIYKNSGQARSNTEAMFQEDKSCQKWSIKDGHFLIPYNHNLLFYPNNPLITPVNAPTLQNHNLNTISNNAFIIKQYPSYGSLTITKGFKAQLSKSHGRNTRIVYKINRYRAKANVSLIKKLIEKTITNNTTDYDKHEFYQHTNGFKLENNYYILTPGIEQLKTGNHGHINNPEERPSDVNVPSITICNNPEKIYEQSTINSYGKEIPRVYKNNKLIYNNDIKFSGTTDMKLSGSFASYINDASNTINTISGNKIYFNLAANNIIQWCEANEEMTDFDGNAIDPWRYTLTFSEGEKWYSVNTDPNQILFEVEILSDKE